MKSTELIVEALKKLGTDLEHFTDLGISVYEVESLVKQMKKDRGIRPNVGIYALPRNVMTPYIEKKYGSVNAYVHSTEFNERKYERAKKTNIQRYGVENISMLESQKKKLRGNGGYFTGHHSKVKYQEKLKKLDYVKGKKCLPKDYALFTEYNRQVWALTNQNIQQLPPPSYCYYTGLRIYESSKANYNEPTTATIDHKISIVRCFLDGVSVEECAAVENLCWAARHFNSIKQSKTETEIKLMGIDIRYKELFVLPNGEFNYENY